MNNISCNIFILSIYKKNIPFLRFLKLFCNDILSINMWSFIFAIQSSFICSRFINKHELLRFSFCKTYLSFISKKFTALQCPLLKLHMSINVFKLIYFFSWYFLSKQNPANHGHINPNLEVIIEKLLHFISICLRFYA